MKRDGTDFDLLNFDFFENLLVDANSSRIIHCTKKLTIESAGEETSPTY